MDKFKVYKETEKTWIVMRKVPLKHIGEFNSLKTAHEVCGFYNQTVEYVEGLQITLKNALEVSKEQERDLRKTKERFKKLLTSKFNKAVKEIEKSELKCYDEQDVMNLLDDILEALE